MTEHSKAMTGVLLTHPIERPQGAGEELNRILELLRDVAPSDAVISFDFDGRLHAHIDVRKQEELTVLEAILPAVGQGMFHGLGRAATPHRPFSYRLSFLVAL